MILLLGFIFGAILQYASLNKYNVIAGMATLENLAVAKTIAFAIGLGAILVNLEIYLGFASYHVKPLILGGVILGGLVFGTGMAILGYCPGTLAISLGEGSLDALTGILGALAGSFVFTIAWSPLQGLLGPDLGSISLHSLAGNGFLFFILLFIFGSLFMGVALWLHKVEKTDNYKWLHSGIALAILTAFIFLSVTTNRVVGASSTYPYLSGILTGMTDHPYFEKVRTAGHWELIFLTGAFIAGLVLSLFKKEFKLTFLHSHWIKYKGSGQAKRVAWSFTGGFLLLFGARMAGGCTSGHVISGGMQLAASSLVFAAFVFAGLLLTGKIFYRKQ